MNNRTLTLTLALSGLLAFFGLTVSATAFAQTSAQPKPSPTPRRALPKQVAGSRGFDFATRDASARLIAAGGTRGNIPPTTAQDFYALGLAEYNAKKYTEAAEYLSQAIKLQPNWADPHYLLALSLTELGRLDEAIAEFKPVIKFGLKDEPKILSYYNMGNAYADLGQHGDAIDAYRQAINLNDKLSKPHNNLGLAYAALNRIEEAVAEFKEAVKLRPDYADAHYNLGVAYLQLGRKQDAEEQRKILVTLKSDLAVKLGALIER
jgi:tetratricopeptide (TPR) repeat protein